MRFASGYFLKQGRRALVCCAVPFAASLSQGSVTGRVTLQEKAGQKTTDLDNAVIWLEPGAAVAKPRGEKVELAMRARQFAPHVKVVPIGSTVSFPNGDPFSHNIFSSTPGTSFDLGLYGKGQTKDHLFAKPGAIPVYCNVHSRMAGFVVVVNTPYYAQATGDGRWTIANVPAGKYTMHVWHERGVEQSQPVTIAASGYDTGEVQLDARGFVLTEHKDKYGKDYTGPGQIRY